MSSDCWRVSLFLSFALSLLLLFFLSKVLADTGCPMSAKMSSKVCIFMGLTIKLVVHAFYIFRHFAVIIAGGDWHDIGKF
ncbi:hypothetical protein [Moraxella lacunata]|uniref:hypothetical protein n=1 Tax=Moraxella lacunata TaxID=477 RepID=UPI003EE4213A